MIPFGVLRESCLVRYRYLDAISREGKERVFVCTYWKKKIIKYVHVKFSKFPFHNRKKQREHNKLDKTKHTY